jgi:hypothetical protein
MTDREIAALLGIEQWSVRERRVATLERIKQKANPGSEKSREKPKPLK